MLLISLDSCLCCEDVMKSKLVCTVLMRPKIRPKHVSAVTQGHVKNHLFKFLIIQDLDCTLAYPLQLHYRLDSWSSLARPPGVQVCTNIHVSNLAYADNIVLLSNSYREMQGLLEAVNIHAAAKCIVGRPAPWWMLTSSSN